MSVRTRPDRGFSLRLIYLREAGPYGVNPADGVKGTIAASLRQEKCSLYVPMG